MDGLIFNTNEGDTLTECVYREKWILVHGLDCVASRLNALTAQLEKDPFPGGLNTVDALAAVLKVRGYPGEFVRPEGHPTPDGFQGQSKYLI